MGRKARARDLIRRALLAGEKGWTQLLHETGLARAALSINLRRMLKEKEVVYEMQPEGTKPRKIYRLSDLGLVRTGVSALSKGVSGQISKVLEKIGRSNPSSIKDWIKGRRKLDLEIEQPGLGKVRLTLHPAKKAE